MTSESRTGFHLRERFSGYKQRAKDKLVQHNITLFVHRNLTLNHSHEDHSHSRFGFRDKMHHVKDVLKNKTHYQEIKEKIKEKIEPQENITYPKGFYDKVFSPETENDIYLQTIVISLWAIALIAIIPTLIVVFIPEKKIVRGKIRRVCSSLNMIFFHVFLCEFCYLIYVLLAMINVAQEFRLASFLCDIANYGMYVTIPIMQIALLFLSLERLSHHCANRATWMNMFEKSFLVQLVLIAIWAVLISIILTVRFIRHQFSFNLIRDQVDNFAPPIFGDVLNKFATRRHHCSIDGRLSSLFKTLIIVLFVVLIVKPILVSLSLNFFKCGCCRRNREREESKSSRSSTTLVTLFLLFNIFLSFPFYFVSMFNSVFTRIDSTKDTFDLVLKICFILRLINIIVECLAFYTFEGLAWRLVSKCFYYLTCKKCLMFNDAANRSRLRAEDPQVRDNVNAIIEAADTEDQADQAASENDGGPASPKRHTNKKPSPVRDQEKKPLLPDRPLVRKHTLSDDDDDKSDSETEETSRKVDKAESTDEKSADETDEEVREEKKPQRQNSRSQVVEPKTNGTIDRTHRRARRRARENDQNESNDRTHRRPAAESDQTKSNDRPHRRARENDQNESNDRSHRRPAGESDQTKSNDRSHRRARQTDQNESNDRTHRRTTAESDQTKSRERSNRRSRSRPAETTVNEVKETSRPDTQPRTTERTSRRERRRKAAEATTTVTSTNETTHQRHRTKERRSSVSSAHEDASKTVSPTKANGQTRSRSPSAAAPVTNSTNAHQSVSPRPKKHKKKAKITHREKILKMSHPV